MRKYQRIFVGLVMLTAVAFFGSGNFFFIPVLMVEILLPILSKVLLLDDVHHMKLEWSMRHACVAGQELEIQLEIKRKGIFLVASMLEMEFDICNQLLGTVQTERFRIPVSNRKSCYRIHYQSDVCGELSMLCNSIYCYDLLGLRRQKVDNMEDERIVIYPREVPVQVLSGKTARGSWEGEQYQENRKGNDRLEVFDLKEYAPGDDIRSIHWKLSEKMNTLLVREGSDSTHYDTMILFDSGLKTGEKEWSKQALSSSVELGIEVSRRLLEQQILHYVAVPTEQGLYKMQISDQSEFLKMVDTWMGIAITEESGLGLKFFQIDQLNKDFYKVIYVTMGEIPLEMEVLSENLSTTALCVTEEGDEVKSASKGKLDIVELPEALVHENSYMIYI